MLINLREQMAGGLPYKRRLEYIESTGTQWIDTGLVARNDLHFTCRVAFTQLVGNGSICAAYVSSGGGTRIYPLNIASGTLVFAYGYGGYLNSTLKPTLGTWYDCETEINSTGQKGYVNGQQLWGGSTAGDKNLGINLTLFRMNGTTNPYAKARLASLSIDVNGDRRDYIPVIDKGDVVCLYDQVSGQFFYNSGTGAFIAGPDAVSAGGGGYKRQCVRRSHRRSSRPSARFYTPRLWKEVA